MGVVRCVVGVVRLVRCVVGVVRCVVGVVSLYCLESVWLGTSNTAT